MQHWSVVFPAHATIVREAAEPPALGAHEVRGPTLVSLISPGTEVAWATGDTFPIYPGYAAVFRVEEVGAAVTNVAPGALLLCMGPHRSFQQIDARHTVPIPDGLAPEIAVFARLLGVAMTTLMTTTARPGDPVVISGAGPVGYLAAQMFKLAGYEVSVVEPDAARRRIVEASGIASTFAAMPGPDSSLAGTVALVLDCSGHEAPVLAGCRIVRKRGEVVLVGVPWRRQTELSAHEVLQAIFQNYAVVRSGWEWEVPLHGRGFVWEELYEGYNNAPHSIFAGFRKALRWLAEGRITVEGLTVRVDPADPARVYEDLIHKRIEALFVLFDWQGRSAQERR